ncbi:hypothetical protein RYX36_000283 [Vicia faba]
MACRSLLRSSIIVETFQFQFQFKPFLLNPNKQGGFWCKTIKARPFHGGGGGVLNSFHNDKTSFHDDQGPPEEAVLKVILALLLFNIDVMLVGGYIFYLLDLLNNISR